MSQSRRCGEKIGVCWRAFLICIICLAIFIYMYTNPIDLDPVKKKYGIPVFIVLFSVLAIKYSKSFFVDQDGITLYMFGIRIRHFPWEIITQIGVATRGNGLRPSPGKFIIVSLHGSDLFIPNYDTGGKYLDRNILHAFTISDPKKNAEKIMKYYGELNYGWPVDK